MDDDGSITHGIVFRAIKADRVWGDGMSPKVLWDVVRPAAAHGHIEGLHTAGAAADGQPGDAQRSRVGHRRYAL